MSDRDVRITFEGNLKVKAEYRGLSILTDQPTYAGGDGSAPAPFDLFLASIATCAGYYVLAFCRQRSLPTEGIYLTMSMEKGQASKMIEKIRIEIHLPAGFPEKYREAAVRAADQCTVKAHILKAPAFEVLAVQD
ncbi:MAG: OsmC family protein [Candidatus Saccharicenans sp.]|nr:OsmC family protein [Candidatus Saccharicenans sp.]MDI6849729.1 OsmC family protein [Candidatus Saccharicenans sp.]